jgi:hypothetical protein
VGKVAGNPDLAVGLEAILKLMTKNRGLEGLDKGRPWGALIHVDDEKFAAGVREPQEVLAGYGFLPITDLSAFLDATEAFAGKPEDVGDGILKLAKNPAKPTYLKEGSGWVFFAPKPELLAEVPRDPSALLGDLPEQYDLAFKANPVNLPGEVREEVLAGIRRNAERDAERKPGESEEEFLARKIVVESLSQIATAVATDTEEVTVGWALDNESGTAYLDLNVAVRAGSDSARRLAEAGHDRSSFAGFRLPDATVTGNWTARLPGIDTDRLGTVMDAIRQKAIEDLEKQAKPARETEAGKDLINGLLDVVQKTLEAGRVDGGMAVMLQPEALTMVTGGFVGDGARLDETLKSLAEAARIDNPAAVEQYVKLDAGEHEGVKLHTVSLPIPPEADNREQAVKLLGETVEVVIGVGERSAFVSAGRNAMETLKQVITLSKEQADAVVPPLRMSVDVGSLTSFVAVAGKTEKERQDAARVAGLLAEVSGGDHVNLVAKTADNTLQVRLEFEEGIIEALGKASQQR